MSKFNNIRKENSIKDYQYDSKLKEVKESTIKYNNGKDIELISQNYIRENTFRRSDYSKKASDQIPKIILLKNIVTTKMKPKEKKVHIKNRNKNPKGSRNRKRRRKIYHMKWIIHNIRKK
jgi:hypothetical protein